MSNLSSPSFTLDSLNSMKVVDLRQELDKRGLDKSGLKSELVKRLEKSLLDESSITDTDEDKMEGENVHDGISELKDVHMESADNNDLMKSESDEHISESSVLDTNKFPKEEIVEEKNQDNEVAKNKLINTDNIAKDAKNVFHKDEGNKLLKGVEIKTEATEMVNGSHKVIDLESDAASNKIFGKESLKEIAHDEIKSSEYNNPEKDPANQENDLLENKIDKTPNILSPVNNDQISKENSGQGSKPISNTASTSSKESSEISESSENKKDSLLKSDNGVKQNEDKKTDLSKCIWISGLSSITKAIDLKDICCKIGKVVGAKVVTSAKSTGSQCFGFVTMSSNDEAKRCIESLHKSTLHDNVIEVEMAKTDPTPQKKSVEKKSEKQDDHSRPSRQSKTYRTSSSSRSTRRDDRGSRRDERKTREIPKEKEIKKPETTIEGDGVKNPDLTTKNSSSEFSEKREEVKAVTEDNDKKDAKSAEQLRKERTEKLEQENKLREERRRKEREKNRLLREEKRKEEEKREKERRERARKEAERVRKEREKQREAEKLREKERERERELFLQERKEREERERRERERERELLERERIEREKLERERKERERLELERIERERQEEERLEKERLARIERENRIEKERQRLEQERLERERRERDRSRIIDRGIDRSIGSSNSLKRSAYDDRTLYYGDSKRSLREDSRDRPVYNPQPDVRRVVQRADARSFDRDRSPIRVEEQVPLRGVGRRDWLDVDVEANAPKTLSDVLGRAGLTGILGYQTENESYDIRPHNKQVDEEQYYLRNPNRIDDHSYRPDFRDSRDGNRLMHSTERFQKERVELSDNRIEIKGLQRYDERRIGDSRKDMERRDNQNSSVFRARNEERIFRTSDPPQMLNSDPKGVFRNSVGDRNGFHPASSDLGGRGLSVNPPRMLPMSEVFGRQLNQQGSNVTRALQTGYVTATNGLPLHQAPQNVSLRDNRLEYTQRARQPHSVIQSRRF